MKKIILLTALAVLLGVATTAAQQIAVVSENGETNVFTTFQAAIEGADPGSVIYLPGGGFPLPDSVKITKKLTIIGIGHKSDNGNVDGTTTISGNLFFNEGSSGSAVLGCYITGDVTIGDESVMANNILIKYCNINCIYVNNNACLGTTVNQSYVRNRIQFNCANGIITNSIMPGIRAIYNGRIENNIFTSASYEKVNGVWRTASFHDVNNTYIANNIFFQNAFGYNCNNNTIYRNMGVNQSIGDNPINLENVEWNDIFENYNGGAVSPTSNFHFKEAYSQYESQVGVYANGVNFDKQMAPVPYIVAKRIAEETDAAGQLKIQVRVKAGD